MTRAHRDGPTVRVSCLAGAAREARAMRCGLAVSLLDPGMAVPDLGLPADSHLVLSFHDIESPVDGYAMPERAHVEALARLGGTLGPGDRVLVHCVAGVSRSPAAAAVILCAATGGVDAARELLTRQGPFEPNVAVLALGDGLLGMGGRLAALAAGDGRDADGAFGW